MRTLNLYIALFLLGHTYIRGMRPQDGDILQVVRFIYIGANTLHKLVP